MVKVGLTGGIATGKSYVRRHFASRGLPTIDADTVARAVVEPGTPGYAAIIARFGQDVVLSTGSLDRAALGRLVFGDAAARVDLEAIVHPAVFDTIIAWLDEVTTARAAPVAVADIPLLFETGRPYPFDVIVVAACAPGEQLRRLMARDGLSEHDARQRIAAQWPIEEKIARADYVVRTDGRHEDTDAQVDRLIAILIERAATT